MQVLVIGGRGCCRTIINKRLNECSATTTKVLDITELLDFTELLYNRVQEHQERQYLYKAYRKLYKPKKPVNQYIIPVRQRARSYC